MPYISMDRMLIIVFYCCVICCLIFSCVYYTTSSTHTDAGTIPGVSRTFHYEAQTIDHLLHITIVTWCCENRPSGKPVDHIIP